MLLLSLVGIAILFTIGLIAPNSSIMWEASTAGSYALLRLGMIIALAALLASHPPRNIYLRSVVGFFIIALTGWCLTATYNNHLGLVDSLAILSFCASAGLAVLELEDESASAQKTQIKTAH